MNSYIYCAWFFVLCLVLKSAQSQNATICRAKADIVFVLDSSSSEGMTNFAKQIDFVKNFVRRFEIGLDKTQFSVVTFSSTVHNNFWLKDHTTQASLLSALSSVRYVSGNTFTDLALSFVNHNSFQAVNGGRPDADKIVIVLTDGESTDPGATLTEADLLHGSGVEVLSIGVGPRITLTELKNIASDPQHVFKVSSFDALHSIETELQNSACQSATVACANKKADIVFVLDSSSSIGSSDFFKQLEFIKNNVRQFDISPTETQISVVSFSDRVYDEFHLNSYISKTQVLGAISRINYHSGNTNTHLALSHVTNETFKFSNGGRNDDAKIVIVLTDGESTYPAKTIQEAKRLHETGAEVIAIGIGPHADKSELTTIATSPDHVFEVAGYDVLSSIQHELEQTTCTSNECRGKKADIVFMLDSSSSEGRSNFRTELNFVKNITSAFEISPNSVQIGIVTFASTPVSQFHLNAYSNVTDVNKAIDNIQYSSGNTYTHLALDLVKDDSFTTTSGMRDGVPHILVVMTDGQSQYGQNTQTAAANVHKAGIKVIAIGIGSDVNSQELQNIATDNDHVITVADFAALATIQKELLNTTCRIEHTEECGDKLADIVFILDSSGSEKLQNFQKQLSFVADFVRQFKIGPQNVQIGLVTFSFEGHNEFYFNTYHDKQSILEKLQHISYVGSTTYTDLGLMYARVYHFTSVIHGARNNAQKIAIVLTDGQSHSRTDTIREADNLKNIGVKIISVGIGSSINTNELNAMATDKQHVFTVANFDVLESIQTELTNVACGTPTKPPFECGLNMTDILVLLDSSNNQDQNHFNQQLDFVKSLISQFQIGPNDVQLGLSTFSKTVQQQFQLNSYHQKQPLLDAISVVPYSGTRIVHTDQALDYARNTGFRPDHGGRRNASHIVVLITTGPSTNPSATIQAGTNLKSESDIDKVISIGVGRSIDENEIHAIASSSSYMIHVNGFNALSSMLSNVTYSICQTCTDDQRADIVFALDTSSSEGPVNFQKQLDFMSGFVNEFPVGPSQVQFGLVTFSSVAKKEFDLNQYSNKHALLSAIQRVPYRTGNTHTAEALEMIRTHSLKQSSGSRPNVHHFVVVLTDGASTHPTETRTEAGKLKAGNVTVLAIGIGSGVNNDELRDIASDNRHVFSVQTFDALNSIKKAVKKSTCDVIQG